MKENIQKRELVKIKLVSSLKRIAGFAEKNIELLKPTAIRNIVHLDLPEDRIVVIINDTTGGNMDTVVSNDDKVLLSPVFGGG